MIKRARAPRVPVERPVEFVLDGGPSQTGTCRNVSATGLFVQSPSQPSVGALIEVTMWVGDGPLVLIGQVVWSAPHGFGVHLAEPDEQQEEALRSVMAHAGNHEGLMAELRGMVRRWGADRVREALALVLGDG